MTDVYFKSGSEKIHKDMFKAHELLAEGGACLHEVIVACCATARHSDARAKLSGVVQKLEAARDAADLAWKTAAEARSEILRLTGCNGACRE